jgi:putative ABC transport system substrate-binding protein
MPRRAFMTAVAGGLLAAPLAAGAQPATKVYHVGILSIGSDPTWRIPWKPFTEAMSELGYVEGRNLVIRPAFADGSPERLPALVAELVRAKVDAIVTTGPRETVAAKRATALIPIVMTVVPDPVAQGFVASLSRPGGNITGLTNFVPGLGQKYVELLRDVLPSATRFAVVASLPNPPPETWRSWKGPADYSASLSPSLECRARTTLTALSLGPRGTVRPASSRPTTG